MCPSEQTMSVKIASVLNEAGIPCVIWGFYAQVVCGNLPMRSDYVTFVVADKLVDKATKTLLDEDIKLPFKLELCLDDDKCTHREHRGLRPTKHLYSKTARVVYESSPDFWVEIFAQSAVLWTLPPMDSSKLLPPPSIAEAEFAKAVEPEYLLASDSVVLPGAHAAGQYPVLVPRPDIQLESYFRILARTLHAGEAEDLESSLRSDIARLVRLVHRLGFLNPELLSPVARELFDKYKVRHGGRDWDKALMEAF